MLKQIALNRGKSWGWKSRKWCEYYSTDFFISCENIIAERLVKNEPFRKNFFLSEWLANCG